MEYVEQYSLFSIDAMNCDFIRNATNKLRLNYCEKWTGSVYRDFMPASFHYPIDGTRRYQGQYQEISPRSINIREASDCIPYY